MPEIIVFTVATAVAIKGADWIGRSGIAFAKQFGLPNFVIGATLVSLATTLPELTIAVLAGPISEEPNLGLGTVLGSPIINLGLIFGIFFLFANKRPTLGYFSRAVNIFIVLAILLLAISSNTVFGGSLSLLLIALGILFILLEIVIGKRSQTLFENIENRFEIFVGFFSFTKERETLFEFIFGIIFLILGCSFMVNSALSLANFLGISELFFSATILALAAALPEMITTINSIIHKREDLALGNLVGSSVIDLSIGVGLATLIHPVEINYPLNFIIFIPLILIGLVCLLSLWKKVPLIVVAGFLLSIFAVFLLAFTAYSVA